MMAILECTQTCTKIKGMFYILNTWYGEAWTGCQSLSSVLLTICSILTKDPLTHEPGCDQRHKDFYSYSEIIRYNNIRLSIIDILNKDVIKEDFQHLRNIAIEHILKNVENIITYINTSKEKYFEIKDKYPHLFTSNTAHSGIYCMSTKINYDKCLIDFNDFVKTLKTNN